MNKKLRIAKVNKVEYCPLSISGIEMQHALAYIFELFGVKVDKQNIFVNDYKVTRVQLQNLHECITSQGSEFQKHSNLFDEYLKIANIDKDKFLQVLDELIFRSDQQNPQILISWSDNKNKPIDINDIKSIQFISEVVLSETLASIPADGLSIEEAFKLYVEAMYWGEGDRFYMAKEDEGDIKISSSNRAFVRNRISQLK